MTFAEAAAYRLAFGMYAGKTIDEIASTDRGLRWLDWCRGLSNRPSFGAPSIADQAIATYLDDPMIAKDLAALLETGGRRCD
jgi:hypothetical protein